MSILLTRGTGFLDAWVARRLHAAGHAVRITINLLGTLAAFEAARQNRIHQVPMPAAPRCSDPTAGLAASDTEAVLGVLPRTTLEDGPAQTIAFHITGSESAP